MCSYVRRLYLPLAIGLSLLFNACGPGAFRANELAQSYSYGDFDFTADSALITTQLGRCPQGYPDDQCALFLFVNQFREAANVPLVRIDTEAEGCSDLAEDSAQDLQQTRRLHSYFEQFSDRYRQGVESGENAFSGLDTAGQIIHLSPLEVFNLWLSSPQHRANMVDPQWTVLGIGHSETAWVQVFCQK